MLAADYTVRREMLLKRLDVTVQSFLWSAKAQVRVADEEDDEPPPPFVVAVPDV